MRWVAVSLVVIAACRTTNETICDDAAECAHGGSSDWALQCKGAAVALETEAKNSGCGDLYDGYYDCARDHATCTASVATFPGCDRTSLDDCLAKARNGNECASLCLGVGCSAAETCRSRCFLNLVKNACAPSAEELDGVAVCSATCQ